jgi:hypothetical protein
MQDGKPVVGGEWVIRPLASRDHSAVLRLNAENRPALAAVEVSDLGELLLHTGDHFVAVDPAGEVLGYLLSFPRDSGYDDSEINALRRHLAGPFVYICQVAVAPTHRGRGLGRALYESVATNARQRGIRLLCCDVNLAPPNPESLAFHHRLGFTLLCEGTASNGFAIAFLVQRL